MRKEKPKSILIIGGARSGKSRLAVRLSRGYVSKCFIATAEPKDEEMRQRIISHKKARGKGWACIEEPLKIPHSVERALKKYDFVVVDCIGIWVSNMLLDGFSKKKLIAEVNRLAEIAKKPKGHLVIVSNEVGMGIVPENELGRRFRDILGEANQILAGSAKEVILMSAGIPIFLKVNKKDGKP